MTVYQFIRSNPFGVKLESFPWAIKLQSSYSDDNEGAEITSSCDNEVSDSWCGFSYYDNSDFIDDSFAEINSDTIRRSTTRSHHSSHVQTALPSSIADYNENESVYSLTPQSHLAGIAVLLICAYICSLIYLVISEWISLRERRKLQLERETQQNDCG